MILDQKILSLTWEIQLWSNLVPEELSDIVSKKKNFASLNNKSFLLKQWSYLEYRLL